jgi:serine/threonine-protein kinase
MPEGAPAANSLKSKKNPGSNPEASDLRPPADELERLPRVFERMVLLKHLARGGMGEVFLAAMGAIEGAERPCVVKIIRREHAEDRSFLARFFDEARIQAQLCHPGVAQVLEAATDSDGKPYVVVEYVEGRNMGELRTRAGQLGTRIHWSDAVAIGVALADALAHVHERADAAGKPLDIVHRDLSPQNVMIGYSGDVKLIDFGTARGENRRCHTVAGIVFAKPGYVAPEVANNNPGGVPADLYALGVMIWELVAGRRFLVGDASVHLAAVAAGRRVPGKLAEIADAPAELDAIVTRLVAQRIEDRYASARQAVTDLVALLKQAAIPARADRSVRGRIAGLMARLYPSEPGRSRADFELCLDEARKLRKTPSAPEVLEPKPPADPSLLEGTGYRIVRELGRGSMGVVYEATHVDLGRTVALKVLTAEQTRRADFEARLRAEARAIAGIDHENLVELHEFGRAADGRPFYAMELLDGEPLDRVAARGRTDWRTAFSLGIQACRALEAAHAAGVVHRDIKPANLFLCRSGSLKLLDFGVAKLENEVEPERDESNPEAIAFVGTPEYAAPEQIAGNADARSDLYALGAVLYELVTGETPYRASNTVSLLDSKSRMDPETPRQRAPKRGIPRMADRIVMRALSRDPYARFQSAAELREALEEALQQPERARRRARRVVGSMLGIVGLAALALGAVGLARPDLRRIAMTRAEPMIQRVAEWRAEHRRAAILGLGSKRSAPTTAAPRHKGAARPDGAVSLPQVGAAAVQEPASPPLGAAAVQEPGSAAAPALQGETDETFATGPRNEVDAEVAQDGEAGRAGDDSIAARLDAIDAMLTDGREVTALHALRKLGRQNSNDPQVLAAWCRAAEKTKAWGEALRIGRQWATVDESVTAQLNLARMQRVAGKTRDARLTLERLVAMHPESEAAQAMLAAEAAPRRLAMGR